MVDRLVTKGWGGGQGAGAFATVEPFLIRGLVTACQVYVVGLPRSDSRRSAFAAPKIAGGIPRTGTDALATASDHLIRVRKSLAAA